MYPVSFPNNYRPQCSHSVGVLALLVYADIFCFIFRSLFPILILSIEILSGQHIPRPKGVDEGEIIDPYVEVYSHYHKYL